MVEGNKEELERVEKEERELTFERFGNEEAFDLGLAFLKVVRDRKLPLPLT